MVNSSVTIYTLPCLSDNYAYVVYNSANGTAAIVDVPEAGPLVDKISELNVPITDIFLTHHHSDHVDGLADLQAALTDSLSQAPARVIGARADAHRLPALDRSVSPGDCLTLCGIEGDIYDVSGHTLGHLALHLPSARAVFTADSLMAMGCGRLFEGSAAQMWHSLQQLRSLPQDTWVYSGHEYTTSNMAFTQSLGEDNPAIAARAAQITEDRAAGRPTVPSPLALELQTNPFMRADDPALKAAMGMPGSTAGQVFAEIRARKDKF